MQVLTAVKLLPLDHGDYDILFLAHFVFNMQKLPKLGKLCMA